MIDVLIVYPMTSRVAWAGLSRGPRILKIVRTFSAFLTGTTYFIAGWKCGANMKATPAASTHGAMPAGWSIGTPKVSNTSALPERLDTERLPCLATFTPHAASRTAADVEMFTVFAPSPPVPTISSRGPATQNMKVIRNFSYYATNQEFPLVLHARASRARSL